MRGDNYSILFWVPGVSEISSGPWHFIRSLTSSWLYSIWVSEYTEMTLTPNPSPFRLHLRETRESWHERNPRKHEATEHGIRLLNLNCCFSSSQIKRNQSIREYIFWNFACELHWSSSVFVVHMASFVMYWGRMRTYGVARLCMFARGFMFRSSLPSRVLVI